MIATGEQDATGGHLYVNSRYQASIRAAGAYEPFGEVIEMSFKRRDREPIYDWRDLQRIKNELFGPESTMLQVFPPESHLVDTANQYYFYVTRTYTVPFGFKERVLSNRPAIHNGRQRPFDPEHMPDDIEDLQGTFDQMVKLTLR